MKLDLQSIHSVKCNLTENLVCVVIYEHLYVFGLLIEIEPSNLQLVLVLQIKQLTIVLTR